MKSIVYLGPTGRQVWQKDRTGWVPADNKPLGTVWVVTDFAEESFVEVEMPRLFGRDRQAFIQRQLTTRFPDTRYRSVVPFPATGGLLERAAPSRQILLGVGNAERLDEELKRLQAPVAGVWPMSLLLAASCRKLHLPDDVLVVLPHADALRIVFVKNGIPLLTRLAPVENNDAAHIEEIGRTQRYLENTRLLERNGKPCGVLLLGQPDPYIGKLPPGLGLIAPPSVWLRHPPADWRFPLFDLALRSPAGQVAPLSQRVEFAADRLRQGAIIAAAVGIAATGWQAVSDVRQAMSVSGQLERQREESRKLAGKIAEVEQRIAAFGVPPELLRRAITLDEQEIKAAPSFEKHLRFVSGAVACHPELRVKLIEWRLLRAKDTPCAKGGTAAAEAAGKDPAAADNVAAPPATASYRAELTLEMRLPETLAPGERTRVLQDVTAYLAKEKTVQVLRNPVKDLVSGQLQGSNARIEEQSDRSWCMVLTPTPTPTPTNAEARQ